MGYIRIWLGNDEPVVNVPVPEVDPDAHSKRELVQMATDAGLPSDNPDSPYDPATDTKAMIAARLSALTDRVAMDGPVEAEIAIPDTWSLAEILVQFEHPEGFWAKLSDSPLPSFIQSDDQFVEDALRREWQRKHDAVVPAKPDDWAGVHHVTEG